MLANLFLGLLYSEMMAKILFILQLLYLQMIIVWLFTYVYICEFIYILCDYYSTINF